MQNNGSSSTGNDRNRSVVPRFEDYLRNDVSSVYPQFNPYREPARSISSSQHQDPINLTVQCLTRLRDTTREVENLQLENDKLRSVNQELQNHLHLVQSSFGKFSLSSPATAAGGDRYNSVMMKKAPLQDARSFLNSYGSGGGDKVVRDESPASRMEPAPFPLPKSISVRSRGYLKMNQAPAAASSGIGTSKTRSMPRSLRIPSPFDASKVYVSPGKKDQEEPLELEVYNQGMTKTELCNKWQETGACPYGANCQFAHGVPELRPVIRHPRYKTEVCRMILSGDTCPYGHRCHFRHALTEQEKLQRFLKTTRTARRL